MAITRVLIANRGEIAVRIARACRELDICPVAIYGEGEEHAPHVRLAGDAYRIPPTPGLLPYLNQVAIIEAARRAGAQAIHPGYGFLAENAEFAEACAAAGLVFIGPPAPAIRAMGDKVAARRLARAAGVPVVPGSDGPIATVDEARAWAEEYGYPVAIKAAGGGGGRGFRVARSAADLPEAFAGSSGEAQRYFSNPTVYLERYLERPRHIEVQIIADQHGTIVSLGERDCSVQRRHQKLIEETPSPAVDTGLRQALGEAAIALARAVGYVSAGTVEFLLDASGFYFLEMNTRIQVEHPITEEVTGIDLVKEQLRIAAGLPLSFGADIAPRGHAIECRINAEDAGRDFAPVPGTVSRFRPPAGPGIRVDAAMDEGVAIHPAYDSLIAKLIAWGRDRNEAIARMRRALAEFVIEGVPTTIPFHQRVMDHPAFHAGDVTTTFLAEHPDVLPPPAPPAPAERQAPAPARELVVEVNGRRLTVRVHGEVSTALPAAAPPPRRPPASRQRLPHAGGSGHTAADGAELTSPLQGTVVRVAVTPGTPVRRGDLICVVEAMKMENEIAAHREGTVVAVHVEPGHAVRIGTVLATIVP